MAKTAAKKKSQGASRNRASSRKSVPGWLWLLLGLAAGLFVAFLWHLSALREDKAAKKTAHAIVEKSKPEIANTPASPANSTAEEPRFDFYTLLPNQQAIPNKKPSSTPTATPKLTKNIEQTAYVLQAGSFKSEAEADKRRASILLLGLPVKILHAPVKPGEIWYRVVVGPLKGKEATQSARAHLRSNGVDSLVLKQN